jgi:hypothetical protein
MSKFIKELNVNNIWYENVQQNSIHEKYNVKKM